MITTTQELSTLSLPELDNVLKKYPWFSLARKELFLRMTSMGEEYRVEGLKRAAVYVFSREGLLKESKMLIQEQNEKEKEGNTTIEPLYKDFVIDSTPDNGVVEFKDVPIQSDVQEVVSGAQPFSLDEDNTADESYPIEEKVIYNVEETPIEETTTIPKESEAPRREIHVVGGDYFSREDLESLQDDGLSTLERFNTLSCDKNSDDIAIDFSDEDYYTETLAKVYAEQGFYKKAIEVYSKLILLYPEKSTYFAALIEELKKYL